MTIGNKVLLSFFSLFVAAGLSVSVQQVAAVSTTTATTSATTTVSTTTIAFLIAQLKQQVITLNSQIVLLQNQLSAIESAKKEIKSLALEIKNQLREGSYGSEVKLLQEILASDPDIYPEGKITGYFGPATKRAVKRFQEKFCISSVGSVGPQTLSKINELLTEGAGNSGKVPSGLLTAPGIQKKLCGSSTSTVTSTSNVNKIIDTAAPVISSVSSTDIGTSTAKIYFKTNEWAEGKIYYDTLTPVDTAATSTLSAVTSGMFKNHNLFLTDLASTTTYYYFISAKDSSGNIATSSESSFTTLP